MTIVSNIKADNLIADKAYDTNSIIDAAKTSNINPVIPSKRNRIIKREIDRNLYSLKHLIENTFQKFKKWRGI